MYAALAGRDPTDIMHLSISALWKQGVFFWDELSVFVFGVMPSPRRHSAEFVTENRMRRRSELFLLRSSCDDYLQDECIGASEAFFAAKCRVGRVSVIELLAHFFASRAAFRRLHLIIEEALTRLILVQNR